MIDRDTKAFPLQNLRVGTQAHSAVCQRLLACSQSDFGEPGLDTSILPALDYKHMQNGDLRATEPY